jgi:hypothetical protein
MEYWYFGNTTENALGTYQASNDLPDTGITCINTWRTLLGGCCTSRKQLTHRWKGA